MKKRLISLLLLLIFYTLNQAYEKTFVLKAKRISDPVFQTIEVKKRCRIKIFEVIGINNETRYSKSWILKNEKREKIWSAPTYELKKAKDKYLTHSYHGTISLEPGVYQVFHSLSKSYDPFIKKLQDIQTLLSKLIKQFSESEKHYSREKDFWRVELTYPEDKVELIEEFNPFQSEDYLICYSRLGNGAFKKLNFEILNHPVTTTLYAQGEGNKLENILYDQGWISNSKGDKVWEFSAGNTVYAGGAMKNLRYYNEITLPPDEYSLIWMTDGTHSYGRWNATPPDDPLFWGISLKYTDVNDSRRIKILKEDPGKNEIVRITRVGSNQIIDKTFTIKKPTTLHIIAIGEYSSSTDELVDYGWIINDFTHEKIWEMNTENTIPDGSYKNTRFDGQIQLNPGQYTVYYVTDDSHDYSEWSSGKMPLNPEMYGITIYFIGNLKIDSTKKMTYGKFNYYGNGDFKYYGEDEMDFEKFEKYEKLEKPKKPKKRKPFLDSDYSENPEKQDSPPNMIVNIRKVMSDNYIKQIFRLDKTSKVRIKAMGEGEDDEMYDYAWLEDLSTGKIRWKMLFENTLHAGGARKNRFVDESILLEKGEYMIVYTTDDSHAYKDWNMNPPNTPSDYGVQIYLIKTFE